MRSFPIREKILTIVPVVVALVVWECLVRVTDNELVPSPSASIKAIFDLLANHLLVEDCLISLKRVMLGFTLATFAGVSIGFCIGLFSLWRTALSPLVELLRPIPPIAWIPIAITIFGVGDPSSYFVIFIGAFYPVLTNTALGVREVPQVLIEAAGLLGASRWRIYKDVILPAALPSIFAGLRVGLGFAWMCVVAAEMIAARSGLGYEIQLNRQLLQLDRVVAGMIVIGLLGASMNRMIEYLELRFIPWRRQEKLAAKQRSIEPEYAIADGKIERATEQAALLKMYPQLAATSSCNNTGAAINLENVCFSYPDTSEVIRDFNLTVAPGRVIGILGASGCGKTSLLRLLAGLETPSKGIIEIDGAPVAMCKQALTMVFQNAALFPWLTALQNIAFPMQSRGLSFSKASLQANSLMQLVGLKHYADRYPSQLSGGQQQRVALARAFACSPRLILMDEPFSALDSQTRESLQEDVTRLIHALGITLILVTHDIREAIFMSDRVCLMAAQPKCIVQEFEVNAPRPREDAFRYAAEFRDLRAELWESLHDEPNGGKSILELNVARA